MRAEYITHMGDDLMIANTARVSFDKTIEEFTYRKDKPRGSDEGILEYLADHNHWTPYGHAIVSLRMKAPVPIRTQCFKHKQGFVENEESRRYISSSPELFIPDHFRNKPSGNAKQGSEGIHVGSDLYLEVYKKQCESSIKIYENMVADGVAPEQARFILPQGCQVNWIWTGSLSAFSRFYNLRIDSHAQKEIQDLAKEVGSIIEPLFPVAWSKLVGGKND